MQAAAFIILLCVGVLVMTAFVVSLRCELRRIRACRIKAAARQQHLLELSPAYQAKVASERAYRLQCEKQAVELTLKQADFRLKEYLALHRLPSDTYLINEEVAIIHALPKQIAASAGDKRSDAAAHAASMQIPAAYDLLDIFSTHPITPEQIFLGKDSHGLLFIKESQLHHAAFAASTGYGKTTLIRGIIPQLLVCGHHVILADLKYTDVTEKGEDWRPIAAHLFEQEPLRLAPGYTLPNIVRREEQIAALLHWVAYPEMQRRLDMRANRNYSYPTLDLFLEELVALTLAYPNVTKDIVRIISLGRELRLNLFTTAQNMQVSSVGLSGGAREQFSTAWFLGGDEISAAALLDMPRKELSALLHDYHILLGQGVGMMRNNFIMPTAGLVRLGYSSNESIYTLLGKASDSAVTHAEETHARHRSYSVPQGVPHPSTDESPGTRKRNGEEPDVSPRRTVFERVLHPDENDNASPFLLFTEEQRTAILEAARQPQMSLRKIRSQAKIGNDTKRFAALKLWLEMNGYVFKKTAADQPQKQIEV